MLIDDLFLSKFFDPNFNLMNLANQPVDRQRFLEKLKVVAKDELHIPIFLPRRWENETLWYIIPRSPQQERILRDQLRAFLAFPLSNYDGTRGNFVKGDPVDDLVVGLSGSTAIKILAPTNSHTRNVFNLSIERLINLLMNQPYRALDLTRPFSRSLRDFEWALQIGDSDLSKKLLTELTSHGRISQENTWYLELHRQEAMGDWSEILGHPRIADLLNLRRPLNVTFLLLRALDKVVLADAKKSETEIRTLLTSAPLGGFASIRLLDDGSLPEDIAKIYRRLISIFENPVKNLDAQSEVIENTDDDPMILTRSQSIDELIREGKFAQAISELEKEPESARRLLLLLRVAHEAPTPELVNRASSEISNASVEVLMELQGRKEFINLSIWVQEQVSNTQVPKTLFDWLKLFHQDVPEEKLTKLFEDHCQSWIVSKIGASDALKIAELIEELSLSEKNSVLRNQLPKIHGMVREINIAEKIHILESCVTVLVLEDLPSSTELGALQYIVDDVLELANGDKRQLILNELLNLWSRIASARRVDWALDLISIAKSTCGPNNDGTGQFVSAMAGIISALPPKSIDYQVLYGANQILQGMYEVSAIRPVFQDPPMINDQAVEPLEKLAGQTVAIYCLEESRSRKIKDALERIVPSCTVTLNSDHVCSDKIKSLAINADHFIVLTSAAKHSATQCVNDHRSKTKTIINIHSTGLSTVLSRLALSLNNA